MCPRNVSRSVTTALSALLVIAQVPGGEAQAVDGQAQVAGTWRGNSECVVPSSPCHDETNVYRFSELAARPGWFSGTGSKVVNGKEISMGTLDWQYDAETRTLESKSASGTFRFVVDDGKMQGVLLLLDATVYRRIHLAKMK